MRQTVLGCVEVAAAIAGAPPCCSGCHNDYEDGTDEPREIQLRDDVVAYVCCCGKADWVRKNAAEIVTYYEGGKT